MGNQSLSGMTICKAASTNVVVGEGPLWDHRIQKLVWLDIPGMLLYIHDPENNETSYEHLPERISCLVPMGNSEYAAAVTGGVSRLYKVDGRWKTEKLFVLDDDERLITNDGRCDSRGRLVLGMMHKEFLPGFGSLYLCEKSSACRFEQNLKIPNGVAWSPNENEIYIVTDRPHVGIMIYEYDVYVGKVGKYKGLIELPRADGMCCDESGNLWIGGRESILCLNPRSKEIIEQIRMPISTATSCVFGGKDLDILYVTTSTWGKNVPEYPDNGSLFKIENLGVKGMAANSFRW